MTIYAAVRPIEEYNVIGSDGNLYGLHRFYGHRPDLLALIMLATPYPYDYEGNLPAPKRRAVIKDIDPFTDSLSFEIGERTLSKILTTMNPMEICNLLKATDVTALPLVADSFKGDVHLFYSVVGARAAAWASSYRGPVSTAGKIRKVSFGGKKNMFDIPEED